MAAAATWDAPSGARWVLAATILGSGLAFLETSVVNVALPAAQVGLGAAATEMQWVANAYTLVLGALILAGGSAGDRYGRRRVFALGVALFAGASAACGLATGTAVLVAARAVQGLGGALLVPNSLAMLSAAFPERERGRAIGTWAGVSALTTALGPVLGGWLVDAVSWRAIFFVVVPVAVAALAITWWRVPEQATEGADGPLDWPGALLATVGLGAVTYGLTAAGEAGLGASVPLAAMGAGVVLLAGFLAVEARAAAPTMPLPLFRSPTFTGANLLTLLLYGALGAAFFFLPFRLVRLDGYSAAAVGAAFLPFALVLGVLSRWAGGLRDRHGARPPLVVGPLVAAAGFALLARPGIGEPYWTAVLPSMVLLGLGMAVAVAPLTTTVMSAVPPRYTGVASGINNAVARVASAQAVAVLGLVALAAFGRGLSGRVAALDVRPEVARAVLAETRRLADARVPPGATGAEREALARAIDESLLASFRWTAGLAAALAATSALAAGLMIERGRPNRPVKEVQ